MVSSTSNSNESSPVVIDGLKLSLHFELSSCEEIWCDLERQSASFYQSFAWCHSWMNAFDEAHSVKPIIIVAKTLAGQSAFVLPFQMRRKHRLRVVEWLSQSDNNYGYGIFDDHQESKDWFDRNFSQLLSLLPKYDVLNLKNMPQTLAGKQNPLASRFRFEAANHSYAMALSARFEDLHASKRSAKSISKIRRRDERLAELGNLTFEIEAPGHNTKLLLPEILSHKNLQLEQQGIGTVFDGEMRAFLDGLASDKLQVFRLMLDGRMISSLVGAEHNSCFWLMITALAPDAPRQFSPGDMLLRKTIEHCCNKGLRQFDFARGVDDYKLIWAEQDIVLYNAIEAATLRGLPYATALLAFNIAKRTIKNSDTIRSLFYTARQFLKGRKR